MKKLRDEIEQLVRQAGDECRSNSKNEYHCSLGKKCPFKDPSDPYFSCKVDRMKLALGIRE